MGDVHHCSGPPVSEMTYTVWSGSLNSSIQDKTLSLTVPGFKDSYNTPLLVTQLFKCTEPHAIDIKGCTQKIYGSLQILFLAAALIFHELLLCTCIYLQLLYR